MRESAKGRLMKVASVVGQRMDQASFERAFDRFEKPNSGYVKVWVCGPPVMQELFDRAQDGIKNKRIQYHIL